MMEADGDAASPSTGDAGEGDGDGLRQRLLTHLAHVDAALRHPVDEAHPALTELRGLLAAELERLGAEADA